MEIKHRISFNSADSEDLYRIVKSRKLKHDVGSLPYSENKIIFLEIYESDESWKDIYAYLRKYENFEIYQGSDNFNTYFSEEEIRESEWLVMVSTYDQGYPQPEGNWYLNQQTLTNVCHKCGIFEQIKPFRIKKEPHLGKKSFYNLILRGEVFAKNEVFQQLEQIKARGYVAKDIMLHRKNVVAETVKQIYVQEKTMPGLLLKDPLKSTLCQECGIKKYYPHKKGVFYYKKEAIPENTDFLLTNEWFGAIGLVAYRYILVSNRVAQLILDHKWTGVRLKVAEIVDKNSDRSSFIDPSQLSMGI